MLHQRADTDSNLVFASMDSVRLSSFLLATLLSTPRLLLHVYVGSVAYDLLDAEERSKMPLHVKLLESGAALGGLALAVLTSTYLWRQMNRILQQQDAEDDEDGDGDGIGAGREGALDEGREEQRGPTRWTPQGRGRYALLDGAADQALMSPGARSPR